MSVQVTILDGPLPAATPLHVQGAGAVIDFAGIVRPDENDRPITGLTYETYDPMAERELTRLGEQAIAQFGLLDAQLMADQHCESESMSFSETISTQMAN